MVPCRWLTSKKDKKNTIIIYSIKHHVVIWAKTIIWSDTIWKKWQFRVRERWFLFHVVVLCPELWDIQVYVLWFGRGTPLFKNKKQDTSSYFLVGEGGEEGQEDLSLSTYTHTHVFYEYSSVSQTQQDKKQVLTTPNVQNFYNTKHYKHFIKQHYGSSLHINTYD